MVELTDDEVVLSDGTHLPANLVVYATGYGSMNQLASGIIGQDMADKAGKVWDSARARQRTRARGRASCATCGSRRPKRACGSTAVT